MITLFKPYISWRARLYTLQVLMSQYIGDGDWVRQFGTEFRQKFGFDYFRTTSSGSAALEIAYDLMDINEGDEIITPILTCVASNISLARRKAHVVFADIDETLNIDPNSVEQKITPKTKAIVFVHFGGRNNNLTSILEIGRRHNIPVIEDAAQAVGSEKWGLGDITCVSFNAIKTLTSGEGGGIVCKDEKHYKQIYKLRWYGLDRKKFKQNNSSELDVVGYKANMNNINAAIGLGNLRSIDKVIRHRNKLRKMYYDSGIESGIWFAEVISSNGAMIQEQLKKAGYESGQHHYRNDLYQCFGGKRQGLPFMNRIEYDYLLLPLHHDVSLTNVKEICKIVNTYR